MELFDSRKNIYTVHCTKELWFKLELLGLGVITKEWKENLELKRK